MTNNRAAVVTAFVAGAMLVAVAVVVYGGPAPTVEKSLAEKKAMLKAALRHRAMQQLDSITFGAQDFGNTGAESGNKGDEWNYGANFGGENAKALARGWTSGANTVHGQGAYNSGGKGMFGKWAVNTAANGPDPVEPEPIECSEKCSNTDTADESCCDDAYGGMTDDHDFWGTDWDKSSYVDRCKQYTWYDSTWFKCDCAYALHVKHHHGKETESEEASYDHYYDCYDDLYGGEDR